jgi:hypothetical protein
MGLKSDLGCGTAMWQSKKRNEDNSFGKSWPNYLFLLKASFNGSFK